MNKKTSRQADAPEATGRTITITLPIGELIDGEAYQVSKRGYPREIRSRRLTGEQGRALAMLRLGFLARSELMDGERYGFGDGGLYSRPVETKEEVVCRILELIHHAVTEAAGE
ncbi:MAG: hypothetical protein ACYC6N_06550 [Pirellulaceae bacterium]